MPARLALAALLMAASVAPAAPSDPRPVVRFATFNAALTEDEPGALAARLAGGRDRQARLVAETIQRVRPHVLLLQEIDRDGDEQALRAFMDEYLAVGQNGAAPIAYPHHIFPPSNTGVPSGVDLSGDGTVGGPQDARGFGRHPGQYAFALLSRLPLGEARTFRNLLWRDMPGNHLPADFYSEAAQAVLPLSSKTHLVAPVQLAGGTIHVIAAHPTPPVFDREPHDWNGRRNWDEIRLLVDLLPPRDGPAPAYLVDDAGVAGGLPPGAAAVVMGDLNADPSRGDSRPRAIAQLLGDFRIVASEPLSPRGTATASFGGGLRVDYALATSDLPVMGTGVVWFPEEHALARLNDASDHRLVWLDVMAPADNSGAASLRRALAPPED